MTSSIERLCTVFAAALLTAAGCQGSKDAQPANQIGKSGFYHLVEDKGVWWFADPEGDKLVSLGINHMEPVLVTAAANRAEFAAKYGDDLTDANGRPRNDGQAARKWVSDSVDLVRKWGFNSLGVHNPVPQRKLPYVAKFRPVKLDGWAGVTPKYPDPFAPETVVLVRKEAEAWCKANRDDTLILGVNFNDMPNWGVAPGTVHPWVRFLATLPAEAPGKKRFVEFLKQRYANAVEADSVFGIGARTWDDFLAEIKWPEPLRPTRAFDDGLAFLPIIADKWFEIETTELRRCDPNHVILGDKFEGKRNLPEWLDPIIGKRFDAAYIQWYDYAENQIPRLRRLFGTSKKPVLMGDSSFAAPNENVPRPKGVRVSSQKEVGEAYGHYLETLLAEPYAVGWHYCGFIEGSPDLAIWHPYYAIQNGLLEPNGSPYTEATDRVTEANARAASWHARAKASAHKEAPLRSARANMKPPRCEPMKVHGNAASRVNDNIYVATKFGRVETPAPKKNISWVVTPDGVVVIDSGTRETAKIAKQMIRETTDKPIRYIIYTHHHGPQVSGTSVLRDPGTQIIAHEDTVTEFDLQRDLFEYNVRLNSIQFDFEPRRSRNKMDLVYPDITYAKDYAFTLGGVTFELHHAVGEADDYTIVSLPAEQVVWVSDMVSAGMPMLGSPMKRVRDDVKWRKAIDLVRGLEPLVLIDSVSPPLCSKKKIDERMDALAEFLDFIHESIARELNMGSTVEQALSHISLPPHLAQSPYLKENYGTLTFDVRGLHQRYSGWFDQNGTSLNPVPSAERAASFIRSMGGGARVVETAKKLMRSGNGRLALEYLDLLIAASDRAKEAHALKSEILFSLVPTTSHRMTARMYDRLGRVEALLSLDENAPFTSAGPRMPPKGPDAGLAGETSGTEDDLTSE